MALIDFAEIDGKLYSFFTDGFIGIDVIAYGDETEVCISFYELKKLMEVAEKFYATD